jgi:glycosyltransferase involved in cell wall biosynthesis
MKLSIIIPVFNEKKSILEVIKKIHEIDYTSSINEVELIVVDDCSTDGTSELLDSIQDSYNFIFIPSEINRGKGYAVRKGISQSTGDLITIQDADLELIPDDIPRMIKTMLNLKIDFINGSRYMTGIIRPLYSYRRYFVNKIFTKFASILINVRLTDLACGYKLFTRNVYNQIILKENRFGFEAELLIKVARIKKTLIAEVPVHYFPREVKEGKKIRNLDGVKILWTIVKYGIFTKTSSFNQKGLK